MKIRTLLFVFLLTLSVTAQKPYFPLAGNWERRTSEQAGFDAAKLKEAIDFAIANEPKTPKNLSLAHYQSFGREPFGEAIGPFKDRGGSTGIIIRNGYIVAEWGDPQRGGMT